MGIYKDTTTNIPAEERTIVGEAMNGHTCITEGDYVLGGHGFGETNWRV